MTMFHINMMIFFVNVAVLHILRSRVQSGEQYCNFIIIRYATIFEFSHFYSFARQILQPHSALHWLCLQTVTTAAAAHITYCYRSRERAGHM